MVLAISNTDHAAHWAVFVATFIVGAALLTAAFVGVATDRIRSELALWPVLAVGGGVWAFGASGLLTEALGWS